MAGRFLLQMAGAPGVGKSTLASAIARARRAVVLDTDVVKSAILDAEVVWLSAGRAGYNVLFALADDLLRQGHSAIIDSPSHYAMIPERGLAIADARGAVYRFIECVCDDLGLLEGRLAARAPRRSQMRELDAFSPDAAGQPVAARKTGRHRWETFGPAGGHLVVDTARPLDVCLSEVLRYLDS